jgi:hypothetical protein
MILHFLHHPATNQKDEPGKHLLVPFPETLHNISEGSEFLDDGIRMKEQPFMAAEESTEPENMENFE